MYDLELAKAAEKINLEDAKNVVIQLPDGLKPRAKEIVDFLKKNTKATHIAIWGSTAFGSCDTSMDVKNIGADLVIHWGHSPWKY